MKTSLIKVVKFSAYNDIRYHKTNAITNKFISESNGFQDEGINTFQYVDASKIIETWYNLIIGKQTIPFFKTYNEVLETIKEIKLLKNVSRNSKSN